jgi:hypothetical protein
MQATSTQQSRHRLAGESLSAFGRREAGAIEVRSTLGTAVARLPEAIDACQELWVIGQLLIPRHWTPEAMRAACPSGPVARHLAVFAVALYIANDMLNQQANDLLPVSRGRLRCHPHGRHVLGKALHSLTLLGSQLRGLLPLETGILFLHLLFLAKRLFPGTLQCARHEAILRFNSGLRTLSPLRLVARSL